MLYGRGRPYLPIGSRILYPSPPRAILKNEAFSFQIPANLGNKRACHICKILCLDTYFLIVNQKATALITNRCDKEGRENAGFD
jgi:hypothetical protein